MPKRSKKPKIVKKLQKLAKTYKQKRKRTWLFHEIGAVIGAISLVVVVLQILYPTDRTLPFTKVADISVGSLTKREAIDYLFHSYSSVELKVAIGETTLKTTTDRAGVLVDFQKAADATARYPWWQRLIPYSLFYKSWVINAKPELKLDSQLVAQFGEEIKKRCNITVHEPTVAIAGSEVVLTKGSDGRECRDADIYAGLAESSLRHSKATAVVTPKVIHPKKTDHIASSQFEQAKTIIGSGLSVTVDSKKTVIPREILASWVLLADDPAKGSYKVELNNEAVKGYLQTLRGDIYIAPFPTDVRLLDGKETSRDVGRPGRDLDYDKTIAQIREALLVKKADTVAAKVTEVQPPLNYLNNYSQSQRGLERLLADIVAQKGNYGISVTELSGMGRMAHINGDRKYVTASTYKLFVAYFVLKDLEGGKLKWDDVITEGLNVRQCFEEMIVRSANRCALAYKARYGAANIVNKMHELGFASVEHNTTWWASPNDMVLYLKKLERGELLQGESREFLLGLLKRQVWRYGIPTGIPGVPIADKVGFLEDYIHDLAIVYSPRGTYILAIMTKGGSYGGLADVGRRVNAYLNQP